MHLTCSETCLTVYVVAYQVKHLEKQFSQEYVAMTERFSGANYEIHLLTFKLKLTQTWLVNESPENCSRLKEYRILSIFSYDL